jgi:Cu/Ag efflux pump CusA
MIRRIIDVSLQNPFAVMISITFLILIGLWSIRNTPLDAIPDLSDVQVIVFTEYPGQSPQVVEDQVTYPLPLQCSQYPTQLTCADSHFSVCRLFTSSSMMAPTYTGPGHACSSI